MNREARGKIADLHRRLALRTPTPPEWATRRARRARTLGLNLQVEGGRGHHVDVARAEGDPQLPVYFQEPRVVATPLEGRLRLAGMLELGASDDTIDPGRAEIILRAARARLNLDRERRITGIWSGLRPCTPDSLPLLGRPDGFDNAILATGHGHLGIVLAPITARLVRELASGRDPSYDLAPMSPDRFRRRGAARSAKLR